MTTRSVEPWQTRQTNDFIKGTCFFKQILQRPFYTFCIIVYKFDYRAWSNFVPTLVVILFVSRGGGGGVGGGTCPLSGMRHRMQIIIAIPANDASRSFFTPLDEHVTSSWILSSSRVTFSR